jgi:aspartate aminotransferase
VAIAKNVIEALERASWIRRMFEAANRLREERGPEAVCDLSLGNPCNEPPPAFFEVLENESRVRTGLRHRYMTNAGYPAVRETMAKHLAERTGVPYGAADICMAVGAAGALNVALRALLDPGDEVVLCSPYFVEYPFYVENFRGQICVVPSRPDFLPDPDRLADACTANTRAVILNAPNNPTGRIYPERFYEELGRALALKSAQLSRPIYLIFDDPYRYLYYTEQPPPEPARFYDQVLYVGSFSKDLGLAGERIGYIAIHPDAAARDELQRAFPFVMRALGHVNAPALLQRAAAELIDLPRDEVCAFYRRRRDRVVTALDECGLEYPPLEGAFYAFPRSPDADDLVFCRRMLDQGLILVPGTAFSSPGHFRLSYAVEEEILERGLEILRQAVA